MDKYDYFIYLLAAYEIAFLLKEGDGPFGVFAWLRNALMRNKYVGVFFYQLFSCWLCCGAHAGYIVYLIATPFDKIGWRPFVLWSLASGAFCYILSVILEKLQMSK
jgi:hypothetical protein